MALVIFRKRWALNVKGQNLGVAFGFGGVKHDICQTSGGSRLLGSLSDTPWTSPG